MIYIYVLCSIWNRGSKIMPKRTDCSRLWLVAVYIFSLEMLLSGDPLLVIILSVLLLRVSRWNLRIAALASNLKKSMLVTAGRASPWRVGCVKSRALVVVWFIHSHVDSGSILWDMSKLVYISVQYLFMVLWYSFILLVSWGRLYLVRFFLSPS